ncbi:MAG: histidine kinase [Bacteroidaceae bacterium]|nr:histidine kinase [Bacteroidaceae bacterium]
MKKETLLESLPEKLIHILVWAFLFSSPLLTMDRSESGIDWLDVVPRLGGPLVIFILFYLNYLILVPKLLLEKSKKLTFVLVNVVVCIALIFGQLTWEDLTGRADRRPMPSFSEIFQIGGPGFGKPMKEPAPEQGPSSEVRNAKEFSPGDLRPEELPETERRGPQWRGPRKEGSLHILGMRVPYLFLFRDILMQILCIIVATSTRMSKQYQQSEQALQIAEYNRKEAELRNLRNQINPHFLLNTLNNIYALIQFDQSKAQETVQELSKLLRHILYDNQQQLVSLDSEVGFMHNYIGLMKIRLPENVDIQVNNTVPTPNNLRIAPLIFISLIENAFKHGIRTSEKSFIHIDMDYEKATNMLHFRIENSNFPKDEEDRSGSGIGLDQVQKRLDLVYPNQYTWEKGVKDNIYFSDITIQLDTKKNLK